MPDLEKDIANWRRQMLAAGVPSPVPLDELEIHLRDEIEQRMRAGFSPQVAFETATQQIGRPHQVQGEFQKIETARDTLKWKLQQLALVAGAGLFPLWVSCIVLFKVGGFSQTCLLYTSDAADDLLCVDLGG